MLSAMVARNQCSSSNISVAQQTMNGDSDWNPWLDGRPSLIIVFSKLEEANSVTDRRQQFLQQALYSALKYEGFKVRSLSFEEGSPLAGRKVLVLGAEFSTLCHWADILNLPKKQEFCGENGEVLTAYRPFCRSGARLGQPFVGFGSLTAEQTFFSPAEVLFVLRAMASKARLPAHGITTTEFPRLSEMCQKHSVLAFAEHSGAVDRIMALHDEDAADTILSEVTSSLSLGVEDVPYSDIAKYFGVHAAQYILFVALYARWLSYLAVAGVVCFILHKVQWAVASDDIATSAPTQVYAVLTAVWCTVFLEEWKRKASEFQYQQGEAAVNYSSSAIVPAHFYLFTLGVTLEEEEVKSSDAPTPSNRKSQKKHSESVVTYLITIAAMSVLFVYVFLLVQFLLWFGDFVRSRTTNQILLQIPTVVNIVAITICDKQYAWATVFLTQREGHIDFKEYLKSFAVKSVFYQLTNILGFFTYVAFVLQDLEFLGSQLVLFMTLKQVIGFATENVVPAVVHALKHPDVEVETKPSVTARLKGTAKRLHAVVQLKKAGKVTAQEDEKGHKQGEAALQKKFLAACESQYGAPETDLSAEYLQLAVQFAVATIFAVVFPLGSLFGVIPALTSKKSDLWKILKVNQRLLPQGADGIVRETWVDVFEALASISVAANVFLIVIGSGNSWSMSQLFLVEHVILFFKGYLSWSIPDTPEWIVKAEAAVSEIEEEMEAKQPAVATEFETPSKPSNGGLLWYLTGADSCSKKSK